MRLNREQTRQITHSVSRFTHGTAEVYLFGSWLDNTARGGDVDLLLESAAPHGLFQRARIKMELEAQLGLPVGIIDACSRHARHPVSNTRPSPSDLAGGCPVSSGALQAKRPRQAGPLVVIQRCVNLLAASTCHAVHPHP